jgi:hypothetical protein
VSAAVSIAVTVPSENSTSLEPTQNQAASNLADQARAHDAVLAGEPAVPSPSEASWLSDVAAPWSSRRPASDLDRPTDAVDDMLATYNGESLDV